MSEYEQKYKNLAFSDEKYHTQECFDLFNLCHELADASSFDNEKKDIFILSNEILKKYLGNMLFCNEWKKLVSLRGPIESISIYTCRECLHTFPVITFKG